MALTAGTSISQYKVIARLGSGGMGEVYLAQDERLRRKVALKLLFEEVTKNEDWVRRFEQEAYAASALNHPNIITIYEVGQTSDSHFISTEFIDGQTLRERLRQQNLTIGETLEIAIQVAGALVAAHAAGIIHRDIKPENVMLRTDGYVKVLDFGLAKFTEQRPSGSTSDKDAETEAGFNTSPGVIMGTVSYMSPEQASGSHIDARTDIFSLGVLIYEMLSGRLPFEGTTPSEIIVSIIQKRQRPLARYTPEIPSELERIVGKSLSKNRDDRYQSLKDMLIDLRRLKRQLELEEDLSDSSELVPSREPSTSARHISQQTGEQKYVTQPVVTEHVSSAQYILTGIKQHKKAILISAAVVITAIVLGAYYFLSRPIDTIAVLPFSSQDAEAERLGNDMVKKITDDLTRMSGLRVISFTLAQQYKGRAIDPRAAGRELNVRAVIVGQIVKRDNSFIVNVELIDTRDGRQLWGMQRPVKLTDLTLIPSEIVTSVAGTVGVKETADEKKKRDAENFYIKGRNAWSKRSSDSITEAIRHFEQALEIDPNQAKAHAAIADCYNLLVSYGVRSPKDAFPKAQIAARKALEIDNGLAEAHAALAYTTFRFDWKWQEAETQFRQAIRLNNDYASAHQWFALLLAARGFLEDAKRETRKAQQVDKTSPAVMAHMGLICYFGDCLDEAINESKKTLEVAPDFSPAHRYLGLAYAQKGMYTESLAEFEIVMSKSRNSPLARAEYANALALAGESSKAETELSRLIERSSQEYVSPYYIAMIYAGLKQKEKAFEWLDLGIRDRADWLPYIKVDPRFDGLHSDPRFTKILQDMNLDR